jgi:hypothetical protein
MRLSFTIDADAMELIDEFAKEHGLERNRAILELLENGYARLQGAELATLNQKRTFEEYEKLNQAILELRSSLEALREEVRLIRHLLNRETGIRTRAYPYRGRKWWELWRGL